jgi:hypothetical protein
MPKQKQNKYPYIQAWGKYMGSQEYYILDQMKKAEKDGAPNDAYYKSSETGTWVTYAESGERMQKLLDDYK